MIMIKYIFLFRPRGMLNRVFQGSKVVQFSFRFQVKCCIYLVLNVFAHPLCPCMNLIIKLIPNIAGMIST